MKNEPQESKKKTLHSKKVAQKPNIDFEDPKENDMMDIEDYTEEVNEVTEHKSTILKRRVRRFGSSEHAPSSRKADKA